jgi:hypothetical protein
MPIPPGAPVAIRSPGCRAANEDMNSIWVAMSKTVAPVQVFGLFRRSPGFKVRVKVNGGGLYRDVDTGQDCATGRRRVSTTTRSPGPSAPTGQSSRGDTSASTSRASPGSRSDREAEDPSLSPELIDAVKALACEREAASGFCPQAPVRPRHQEGDPWTSELQSSRS